MKNIRKHIFTFGLLLFFTLLFPNITPLGVTSTAKATSIDKESDVKLNLRSITLVKGKSFTLKLYNLKEKTTVSFKSNESEIASVNENGTITANKVGTTTITAIVRDGSNTTSLYCDVTVGPPAISVKLTKSKIILGIDKIDLLKVILKPSNTAEVARFSSYDSSTASVSTGGRVTGKKAGLTYLFAEIGESSEGTKKFASCTVIVTSPDDAPLLETYFNEHPELDLLPEYELRRALAEFFNGDLYQNSKNFIKDFDSFINEKFPTKNKSLTTNTSKNSSSIEVVSD